jgi:hypothetical protein
MYPTTFSSTLTVGCEKAAGTLILSAFNGNHAIRVNGNAATLRIGTVHNAGEIIVRDGAERERVVIDGSKGDVTLENADCAEDFDTSKSLNIDPGTVVVFDEEGKIQKSTKAYDKKVAGVVSGAGNYKPAIVLDKKTSSNKRVPVALVGKVFCKVDAKYSSIEVGDLLTTSNTAGHAMAAKEQTRAFGAVIGKALKPLKSGKNLIPILVALQ